MYIYICIYIYIYIYNEQNNVTNVQKKCSTVLLLEHCTQQVKRNGKKTEKIAYYSTVSKCHLSSGRLKKN